MSNNPSFDSLYNRTLRFLSYRPRSEKEVREYLTKKVIRSVGSGQESEIQNEESVDESLIEQIISKLKDYKFINDLDFALWFIENRKKGFRMITLELREKGIKKETIDQALKDFDLEKKENALISKLMEKKWKTVSRVPKEKQYEKMMRFLLSRGFDYDKAKKAFKEFSSIEFDD